MSLKNKLKKLNIGELSLVDRPANQGSLAILHKRDEGEEVEEGEDGGEVEKMSFVGRLKKFLAGKTDDEVVKAEHDIGDMTEAVRMSVSSILEDDEVVDKATALVETLEQFGGAVLEKFVPDAGATTGDVDITKMTDYSTDDLEKELQRRKSAGGACPSEGASPDDNAMGGKGMKKNLDPEVTAEIAKAEKRATDAETKLAEIEKREKDAKVVELAKSMVGKADVKPEELADVLKQLSPEAVKVVEGILAKHNALLKGSKLFTAVGSDEGETPAPLTRLGKLADDLRKADPKMTQAQAVAKALAQNPELYEESLTNDDPAE